MQARSNNCPPDMTRHEPARRRTEITDQQVVSPSGSYDTTAGPVPADDTTADMLGFSRRLRRARMARRWSQLRLAHKIHDVGTPHRGTATVASLVIMISKWENDRKQPSQYNLHLLAAALQLPVLALGLPVDPDFTF